MVTKPPGSGVSEFVAFALLDELIRTLLGKDDAAALIGRTITSLEGMTPGLRDKALIVLKEMLHEYRK